MNNEPFVEVTSPERLRGMGGAGREGIREVEASVS